MGRRIVVKRPTNENGRQNHTRKLDDNKIFVARHRALYQYCREIGLISHETPAFHERIAIRDIKGKDVVGALPLELACYTNTYTEVPLTCHITAGKELNIEDVRLGAKQHHTYKIEMVR